MLLGQCFLVYIFSLCTKRNQNKTRQVGVKGGVSAAKSRAWPADSGRRMRPVCTDSGELAVRKSPEIGRRTQ